jgi:uncharacterized protein
MRYLDTSVLVAAITNERDTAAAQRCLASAAADEVVAISDWVLTEVASALSAKVRMRALSAIDRRRAAEAFELMVARSFTTLPVTSAAFAAAAVFAEQHRSGIRAGDALHLAVAAAAGATVHTLDKGLVRSAKAVGVAAVLVT